MKSLEAGSSPDDGFTDKFNKNMERPIPEPGETYRHFKGSTYKILLLSFDTETEQQLVSYQSTDGGKVWTRPLNMFMEKVGNEYRFEKLSKFYADSVNDTQ